MNLKGLELNWLINASDFQEREMWRIARMMKTCNVRAFLMDEETEDNKSIDDAICD